MDDDNEKKKAKGTKKVVMKGGHTFEIYNDCLFNGKTILKKQQRFKSDYHKVYTEDVSKTALSSKDDKRLDGVTTYSHRTNAFKLGESEMMISRDVLSKYTEIVHFMMK